MKSTENNKTKANIQAITNVKLTLMDKDGNVKPLFQPRKLVLWLIKKGILSPFHPKNFIFGSWGRELNVRNLVTNAGLALIASRIGGADAEAAADYIAIGTGSTSPAITDTALATEITTNGGERDQGTTSRQTTNVTSDTARCSLTYSFTGTFAVVESGLFNDASAGDMLCRDVFSVINVESGDSLAITWDVIVTAA